MSRRSRVRMNMPDAVKAPLVPSRAEAVRMAGGNNLQPFTAVATTGETIVCTPPMNGSMTCTIQGGKAMMTPTGDIVKM